MGGARGWAYEVANQGRSLAILCVFCLGRSLARQPTITVCFQNGLVHVSVAIRNYPICSCPFSTFNCCNSALLFIAGFLCVCFGRLVLVLYSQRNCTLYAEATWVMTHVTRAVSHSVSCSVVPVTVGARGKSICICIYSMWCIRHMALKVLPANCVHNGAVHMFTS